MRNDDFYRERYLMDAWKETTRQNARTARHMRRRRALAALLSICLIAILLAAKYIDDSTKEPIHTVSPTYYHLMTPPPAQTPVPTPTNTPVPTPSPEPVITSITDNAEADETNQPIECPISEEEVFMLAQTLQDECGGVGRQGATGRSRMDCFQQARFRELGQHFGGNHNRAGSIRVSFGHHPVDRHA